MYSNDIKKTKIEILVSLVFSHSEITRTTAFRNYKLSS